MTDPAAPEQPAIGKQKSSWLGGCLLIFLLLVLIGTCNRIVNGPPEEKAATVLDENEAPVVEAKPKANARVTAEPPKAVKAEAESLPKCDSWLMKWEVVRLFKKAEVQLVKVYEPTEVMRSSTEVQCTARAVWSDGRPDGVWFRMYLDEEGDHLIEAREAPLE